MATLTGLSASRYHTTSPQKKLSPFSLTVSGRAGQKRIGGQRVRAADWQQRLTTTFESSAFTPKRYDLPEENEEKLNRP